MDNKMRVKCVCVSECYNEECQHRIAHTEINGKWYNQDGSFSTIVEPCTKEGFCIYVDAVVKCERCM